MHLSLQLRLFWNLEYPGCDLAADCKDCLGLRLPTQIIFGQKKQSLVCLLIYLSYT